MNTTEPALTHHDRINSEMAAVKIDRATVLSQPGTEGQTRTHTLQAHLSEIEGQVVAIETTYELDLGVSRIETSSGTKWVVRDFSPDTPLSAIEQTADILSFLSDYNFPAERTCGEQSIAVISARPVFITHFISGTRARLNKDSARELGRLLGVLHTLPYKDSLNAKKGGGWHHLTPTGGILEEVSASKNLLEHHARTGDEQERIAIASLLQTLDSFHVLSQLPEALVHPDFVPSNAIEVADGGLHIVDWLGSGLGPRILPLGFLLMTASFRSIRLVDVVLHAYRKHVELQDCEIDLLPLATLARWLTIGCWEVSVNRKTAQHILGEHNERTITARAILERVKAILC